MTQGVYVEDLMQEMDSLADQLMSDGFGPELLGLGGLVREEFELHFMMAQGPDGPWPERVREYPHPILRKTRKLLSAATIEGASGNVARSQESVAEFGVDGSVVDYAAFHEYGTVKLPPRPWAYLSDTKEEEAADRFGHLLFEKFFSGS